MNPHEFTGSKIEEDPHKFIDEVKKILQVIQMSEVESVEFSSYQLKDVDYLWFTQWKDIRGKDAALAVWDDFVDAFIDKFFSRELREATLEDFMNLEQGSMSVKECGLMFTQLSRYAPEMVAKLRVRMNNFFMGFQAW